jgi:Amt family ammonium transporter
MKRLIGLNIAVALAAAFAVLGAAFGGIRVTEEQEKLGLDITEHGIEAYPDYAMSGSGVGNR